MDSVRCAIRPIHIFSLPSWIALGVLFAFLRKSVLHQESPLFILLERKMLDEMEYNFHPMKDLTKTNFFTK